ncbi:MAG: TetR/AcrR family transcriptional regulator C-terminal domain-containing protein [Deltaproteobacteria bacterium]|nr:TetR/AcrR family transcriptional regulator C-terminal domain-containing protein [Deltaproteobacteria bacterium]
MTARTRRRAPVEPVLGQSPGPRYLQIAAEFRRRIASGALRPNVRLPSVRAIAAEFGVALATATRAVEALVRDGYVRTAARVGTVVAVPRRAAPAPHDAPLTRDRIVRAAIAMADDEGLASFSARGVAAKLGVPTMSLYRHVRSKDQLLQWMTEHAIGEEPLPDDPPAGWRAQLELAARLEWRAFRRHPWLARVMIVTRPQPLPNTLAYAEWMLRALDGLGLSAPMTLNLHIVVHSFIQGLATNLDAEAQAQNDTGQSDEDWMTAHAPAFAALATSGRFPTFGRIHQQLADGFDLDLDALFELGLRTLLDGIGASIAASPRVKPRRRASQK